MIYTTILIKIPYNSKTNGGNLVHSLRNHQTGTKSHKRDAALKNIHENMPTDDFYNFSKLKIPFPIGVGTGDRGRLQPP